MPSHDGNQISSYYVKFLEDLDFVPTYAWGAALFSFLINGLRRRRSRDKVDGNFWYFLASNFIFWTICLTFYFF